MSGPSDLLCQARGHHRLAQLRADIASDVQRYLTKSPENIAYGDSWKRRLSALLTPELVCLVLHRLAHHLHARGWRGLAQRTARFNHLLHKVAISPQSCIGPGIRLSHPPGVCFHGRAGARLTLFSLAQCASSSGWVGGPVDQGPQLGDDVTIGAHAAVLGPWQVGSGCLLAPAVHLQADAPPQCLVVSRSLRLRHTPIAPAAADDIPT